MTYAELAFKSAFRNRLRTVLTALGVAIAVVAFLFLRTIIASFSTGVENASQDRMITRNKISVTFPLPLAYGAKIKNVPGVSDLSWSNWFGGMWKDPKNFFPRFGVDAESSFRVYPDYVMEPAERAAFFADRTGCVVGTNLAEKYGFKVGDIIHMSGDIYPGDWDFTVRAIYKGAERSTDTGVMFFHWKYLDERVPEARKNLTGVFVVRVADSTQSVKVGQAIDQIFENSINETRTESERAFQLSFLSMLSALVSAINLVSLVMLAILTLILGNTMAMSTRERTSEYAMMRSIGFRPVHVFGLVLGEAVVVALLGFAIGAVIAPALIQGFADWGQKQFGSFLRGVSLQGSAMAFAGAAALIGGLVATGIPAFRAARMSIVDALRKVE